MEIILLRILMKLFAMVVDFSYSLALEDNNALRDYLSDTHHRTMIRNQNARIITEDSFIEATNEEQNFESLVVVSFSYSYNEFNCSSLNMNNLKYLLFGADCWTSYLTKLSITGL